MKNTIRLFVIFAALCTSIFTSCKFNPADMSVKYTVSHYVQNVEDDEYTFSESEEFSGTSGETANIQLKSYEGFTALPVEDSKISNGKNIVVKYNRNIITCTLNYNGGTVVLPDGTEQTYDVINGKYGAKITKPVPLKKGYALEDWTDSNGNVLGEAFLYSGTFTANYVEKSTSSYTVHHFYQNIDNDNYTENAAEKEILEGRAGTKTAAVAKNVEGFTALNIEQTAILSDESTEVNVYYDRNLVTFSFNLVGGDGETSVSKKYGTPVSSAIVKDPAKDSSTFSGWKPELPDSFTKNMNFTAVWNVPSYTVKYLFENLNDSKYSEDEKFPAEKYYGTKGELTEVRGKAIPGFTAQEITQAIIKDDNSTVVFVKYKRNVITLYIDLKGGVGTSYIQGKFGQGNDVVLEKLGELKPPIRAGFTVDENNIYEVPADLDFSLKNDETKKIDVIWTGGALVSYTVVILKERADYSNAEDRYESAESHIFNGIAGKNTDLVENTENNSVSVAGETFRYENFIPEGNRNIQIEGDESTVLYVYFNRKIINITYDLNGGNIDGKTDSVVISGRYESTINNEDIPQNLLREGCVSYTWDSSYSKFPAEDKVVKANWTGKPYTVTFHLGDASEQKTYNYAEEYFVPGLESFTSLSLADGGVSGWKLSADSESVTYACGAKFTLPSPAALDLYANVDTNYYTVRYLQQHINDDEYDEKETVIIFAAAGSTTNGFAKDFEGFHVLPFEQITVAGDSSTVLDIKYDRNIYTLHFDLDGGYVIIRIDPTKWDTLNIYELPDVECRYGSTYNATHYGVRKVGYFWDKLRWENESNDQFEIDGLNDYSYSIENIASDMNLTLTGEKTVYKVFLHNTNGLLTDAECEFTVSVDTEDKELPALSIVNYEFAGWYRDANFAPQKQCTASTFKEALLTVNERSSNWWNCENQHFYAKWTYSTNPSETKSITQVGDIVLKDGMIICNPKPAIEGFVLNLTEAQKAKAIGIVSHKVNGTWRFIGKYNSPKNLYMRKVLKTSVTEENDGFNTISIYEPVKTQGDVLPYIFGYASDNGITTDNGYKSEYTSNWYLPAINEMASMKENLDHISTSLGLIGGATLPVRTESGPVAYNSCKYQYVDSMTSNVYVYRFANDTSGPVGAGFQCYTLPCHKFE